MKPRTSPCRIQLVARDARGRLRAPGLTVAVCPCRSTSLLSPRSLCQGVTRAGQPCRKKAVLGQNFCHVHA